VIKFNRSRKRPDATWNLRGDADTSIMSNAGFDEGDEQATLEQQSDMLK
jgi:hypothetical protein